MAAGAAVRAAQRRVPRPDQGVSAQFISFLFFSVALLWAAMPVTFAGSNIFALGATFGVLAHAFSNRVRKVNITHSTRGLRARQPPTLRRDPSSKPQTEIGRSAPLRSPPASPGARPPADPSFRPPARSSARLPLILARAQDHGRSRSRRSLAATPSSGGMASASVPRRSTPRSSQSALRPTRTSSPRRRQRRCRNIEPALASC